MTGGVSVPCRGLWFVNGLKLLRICLLDMFPSPVGVYGLLMALAEFSGHTTDCFRPLSGFMVC